MQPDEIKENKENIVDKPLDSHIFESERTAEKIKESKEQREQEIYNLMEELQNTELSPEEEKKAIKDAEEIEQEKEKIKKLLFLAQDRGLVYAVKVANNMKDPYIIDSFHDVLSKDSLYKKFVK